MIADMSLNATSWRRRRRSATSLRSSQSSPHAPFLKCGLFACSALNARSNDCHVGLLCMTQRAQYRTQMWVRTLCVVVRTDFLCYPLHFQHKKLNSPWRCSRVPVGADPRQGAISSAAAGPEVKVASRKSFGVMALTKLLVRDAHSTQAHRSTMRKRLNMHML